MSINKDICKQLIDYSNDIANMYNELYLLEIKGEKNSNYYNSLISLINFIKEKEEKIYNSIPIEQLQEYINFFTNAFQIVKKDKPKTLFVGNPSYAISRINNELINRLEYHQSLNSNKRKKINGVEVISIFELLGITDYETHKENTNKFHYDILKLGIIFLNELINDIEDPDLKNILIKHKYRQSFLNIPLERNYLFNKFDIKLDSIHISEYKKLPYIISQAYHQATIKTSELLNEKTYSDKETFIINLALLKAYLYFLSSKRINCLINDLSIIENNQEDFEKAKTKIINEMKDTINRLKN